MTPDVTMARPSGARLIALVATVAGLGLSIYLTVEHYTGSTTLACPASATVNCEKVTESSYGVVAGVPVALLGLLFFAAAMVVLALPGRGRPLLVGRVVGAGVGVVFVFWLVYVELFRVEAICLWCTGVHLLTLVVFVATLWDALSPAGTE